MPDAIFKRLFVPIADADDAEATSEILASMHTHLSELFVVHIVRGEEATASNRSAHTHIFEPFESIASDQIQVETAVEFCTEPMDTIASLAADYEPTAIAVRPRDRSPLRSFFSGTETTSLVQGTAAPVVVLPKELAVSTPDDTFSLVVPLDGSDRAFEALRFACDQFDDPTIIALHVVSDPKTELYTELTPHLSSTDEQTDRAERVTVNELFVRAYEIGDEHDATIETYTLGGNVARAINQTAVELDADGIVFQRKPVGPGKSDTEEQASSDISVIGDTITTLITDAPVPVYIR